MLAKPIAKSSSGAVDYYYKTEGHNNTEWGGRGAQELGLRGEIRSEDFREVVYGNHPHDSNVHLRKTAGKDSGRAGWDFTFSLSKNASILAFQDRRILDAFRDSVRETMKIAEQRYAQTRKADSSGKIQTEHTGNLVYAQFTHYNSRANDPQIHSHVLVMNATRGSDGKWRALDNKEIYSNYKHIGLIQEHILANKLRELGYKVEINRKTGIVDIKTGREDIREYFSKRSEQIKQAYEQYKDQFKYERDAKQKASWSTREEKDHNFTYNEMKDKVSNELKQEFNIDLKELKAQSLSKDQAQTLSKQELNEIVKDSMRDVTQTQSVFTREQLEDVVLRRTLDKNVSFNDIQKSIDSQRELIRLDEKYYTTREIQQMERETVEKVKQNEKTYSLMNKDEAERFIQQQQEKQGFNYTDGQKEFIEKALTNNEKYLIVQGNAGSGKTASIEAINKAYVSQGYRVIGIAPTGKATNLLKDAGIQETYTIARFKQEIRSGNLQVDSKTTIITDEASMVSSRDMHFVVNQNAGKTILVGDVKQFKPIEQGKTFEDIQKNIDKNSFVDMQETVRFKTAQQKEIAELMNKGKYEEAINKLDQQGNIKEISDQNAKLEQIKKDYIENYESGKNTILITNTNAERETLNREIRHELQERGYVSKQEYKIDTYSQRNLTDAEKNFAENYAQGDKVIFHRGNYKGEGHIKEIDKENNKLVIKYRDGTTRQVNANELKDASVYKHEEKEFAQGDKVIFLKNDKGLNVANGETGKVIEIDNNKMTIQKETGERVTINTNTQAGNSYNYIDHAYAVTNYKAQGQTADVTMYSHNSNTVTNQQSFYVASTRAREQTTIYTDSKQALREQVQQEQQKLSTRDFDTEETQKYEQHTEEKQEETQEQTQEEQQEEEHEDEYLQQSDIEKIEQDLYNEYEETNELSEHKEEQQEQYEEHVEEAEQAEEQEQYNNVDVDMSR